MAAPVYNALGIFGRLRLEQETHFLSLQRKYAPLPQSSEAFGIFPHLTVVAGYKVAPNNLEPYTELLRELRTFLPLTLNVTDIRIIGRNIALAFEVSKTEQIRTLATGLLPHQVVKTGYCTVVREVPEAARQELLHILADTHSLTFEDFKLCANRVDDAHILQTSSRR